MKRVTIHNFHESQLRKIKRGARNAQAPHSYTDTRLNDHEKRPSSMPSPGSSLGASHLRLYSSFVPARLAFFAGIELSGKASPEQPSMVKASLTASRTSSLASLRISRSRALHAS